MQPLFVRAIATTEAAATGGDPYVSLWVRRISETYPATAERERERESAARRNLWGLHANLGVSSLEEEGGEESPPERNLPLPPSGDFWPRLPH